uniref:Ribosomal protein L2 n=1 Tax=Romanomermis culicivorax TaxID=13658 RepID=A0A915IVV7_ROMCU
MLLSMLTSYQSNAAYSSAENREKALGCRVALYTPRQGAGDRGGAKRRLPIGGAAYGTPKKIIRRAGVAST